MIIFCKQYDQCSAMYLLFKQYLSPNFSIPCSAPDLSKYRLVDMYTRCTEAEVKEVIFESFSNPDGNLRIVIGTIAFGMGLDCPNVRHIIHWGPSTNIESYIHSRSWEVWKRWLCVTGSAILCSCRLQILLK